MSGQPSLCREAGDVVARLLAGAVLLCVASNAVFLFYLPSRRRRASDGRGPAQGTESRQPAGSQEGGQAGRRASPAEQRSEAPSADRRRSTAGQRSGSGPNRSRERSRRFSSPADGSFPAALPRQAAASGPPAPRSRPERPLTPAGRTRRRSRKAGREPRGPLRPAAGSKGASSKDRGRLRVCPSVGGGEEPGTRTTSVGAQG